MIRVLAVAILGLSSMQVEAEQYRSFNSVMDGFNRICIPQLTNGDQSIRANLQKMSSKQVESLLKQVGSFMGDPETLKEVFAAYAGKGTIILAETGQGPGVCFLNSFSPRTAADFEAEWDSYLTTGGREFRVANPGHIGAHDGGVWREQYSGFMSTPVMDGFIQVSSQLKVADEFSWLLVAGARVGRAPASCELWPERC